MNAFLANVDDAKQSLKFYEQKVRDYEKAMQLRADTTYERIKVGERRGYIKISDEMLAQSNIKPARMHELDDYIRVYGVDGHVRNFDGADGTRGMSRGPLPLRSTAVLRLDAPGRYLRDGGIGYNPMHPGFGTTSNGHVQGRKLISGRQAIGAAKAPSTACKHVGM
ncbi:hypothetical protein SeLEV6574_g08118 [Synchytrium endobioticum]|uniref:Uncharacterized protein n=1 Tax=Synchytrium endobioticum TaxID=286115 RepID=A0A507C9P6_9FUNG|nr:hypothetical protein SeLEV6574_g08118 [Synchytrium endobioticum]